ICTHRLTLTQGKEDTKPPHNYTLSLPIITSNSSKTNEIRHQKHLQHWEMLKKPVSIASPPRTHLLIWCVAVICMVLTVAVIVTGITVFVGYLVIKPRVPLVRVAYAHLDMFSFDQDGVLTTKLTLVISAENDNMKARASFSDFSYLLTFDGIKVALLKAMPFDVLNNKSLPLKYVVEANPIPLNPHKMSFADSALKNDMIPFELNGHTRARWRVGPLGSIKFWCNLHCHLHFGRDGDNLNSTCSSNSI
ncbi:hypothetical protein V2J09_000870, partial [Rumex salicifolius]